MRERGRVLPLLSLGVALALVIAAPQAAATPIEVEEATGEHCPALSFSGDTVSGGCVTHLVDTAEGIYPKIAFGVWFGGNPTPFHLCNMEMTMRMDEDGNAAISDVAMSNCNGSVIARACDSSEAHAAAPNNGEVPWRSAAALEETSPGEASLPIAVCYRSTFYTTDCEAVVTFMVDTTSQPYSLSSDFTGYWTPTSGCFMEGSWAGEAAEPAP